MTSNCINAIIQLEEVYYSINTVETKSDSSYAGNLQKGETRMISFEQFVMADGSPIYVQILLYIKRGLIAGNIVDGDELPSRRVLSALLGVNPNTVQKAYKLLEEEGLIQSRAGAKSYVAVSEEKLAEIRAELLDTDAKDAIAKLRQMGVSKEEAHGLIERFWEET